MIMRTKEKDTAKLLFIENILLPVTSVINKVGKLEQNHQAFTSNGPRKWRQHV